MARLEFVKDADGNITKVAEGMYSKDDVNEEYVKLHYPCDCTGQVEHQQFQTLQYQSKRLFVVVLLHVVNQ